MRIRSIRPEFWSSEDIARLPWETRLIFIGLWSYVDDNGVGRDLERLIVADLFPLDEDIHGALMQIAGALKQLETGGQITRYTVDEKPYLHITAWDKHQRINRPSEGRYPLPTCGNAILHDTLSEPSVSPHLSLSAGEGEKGRRGEGEKNSCASTDVEREFAEFYSIYPRKKAKADALKAYRAARKKVAADVILTGLRRLLPELTSQAENFRPYPASWLRSESWDDELTSTDEPQAQVRRLPQAHELETPPDGLSDQEYHEWAVAQAEKRRRA